MTKFNYSDSSEFNDLFEGIKMDITLNNGDVYEGLFEGMDDNIVMLKSLKSNNIIGITQSSIDYVMVDESEYITSDHYYFNVECR